MASSTMAPEPCPHIEVVGNVLQDNPRTLNAGIIHDKRELRIVIARSSEDAKSLPPRLTQDFFNGECCAVQRDQF